MKPTLKPIADLTERPDDMSIRPARAGDADAVAALLVSVARWLATDGPGRLWDPESFRAADIAAQIARGEVVVLRIGGRFAASMCVLSEDPEFRPSPARRSTCTSSPSTGASPAGGSPIA